MQLTERQLEGNLPIRTIVHGYIGVQGSSHKYVKTLDSVYTIIIVKCVK